MLSSEASRRDPHGVLPWLVRLPRRRKRLIMVLADLVALPCALLAALWLKLGNLSPSGDSFNWTMLGAVLLSLPVFARIGLYRAVIRFMGPQAALAVIGGVTLSTVLLIALNFTGLVARLPIAVFLIYWSLAVVYAGGSRMFMRWLLLSDRRGADRVVIYGAGEAGTALARSLTGSATVVPVAFVDDDPHLHGMVLDGLSIFSSAELPDVLARARARRVLLAMPTLSVRRRREILARLEPLGVHVQKVPDISAIVAGGARVEDIQDVDAADLLGRSPVPPNHVLLDACILGKCVMVTGAGGSIGAELCRQILPLAPSQLLLFEMSELALYNIERELRLVNERCGLNVEIVPLLGNAHDRQRLRDIIQSFGVKTIYHAAAYKHVPIVEQNVIEGLQNNVVATWHAAEAAVECRVETFVLVSTDKAVRPTNVMGASKRFAEIVLQGVQQRGGATRFCIVRFGNVLESSGSVVPLFREQIRAGGPITVTHPDVIRYFMTIPEAAQLVIQAGSMATGGDVFVLDMGKPIRIVDLARRMVQLAGLTVRTDTNVDGDIEIRFTGLRPAEKLYEELLIGENAAGTEHPMIMRAAEQALPWPEVQALLDDVSSMMRRFDCAGVRDVLARAVREYAASAELQDLVWLRRRPQTAALANVADAKVADLAARRARQPYHPPAWDR
jgi:FlaA1/EpsC-like NDP-sugar epimerase